MVVTASSRLSDVLREVQAIFSVIGDATPIMVGRQYVAGRGIGSAPRVVFVPHAKGSWGPVNEINSGHVAGIKSGCNVYVRGVESGDDLGRMDAAEDLAARVLSALRAAAPGRIEGGDFEDDSPTDADAYGADIALTFSYARGVPVDTAIRAAARQRAISPGVSPPDPDRPNGSTSKNLSQSVTLNGSRS